MEFQRHNSHVDREVLGCAIMQKVKEIYTPYACNKLEQKISKALSYKYSQESENTW